MKIFSRSTNIQNTGSSSQSLQETQTVTRYTNRPPETYEELVHNLQKAQDLYKSGMQHQANAIQHQANAIQHQANAIQHQANAIQHQANAIQLRTEADQHQESLGKLKEDLVNLKKNIQAEQVGNEVVNAKSSAERAKADREARRLLANQSNNDRSIQGIRVERS